MFGRRFLPLQIAAAARRPVDAWCSVSTNIVIRPDCESADARKIFPSASWWVSLICLSHYNLSPLWRRRHRRRHMKSSSASQKRTTDLSIYTVSQKNVPTFTLSVTLSNLKPVFKNFCTAGKCMKFATKPIWHYPAHLTHVATIPWEIKNSNFLQIFSNNARYGRKCKKMHFKCISFNFSAHVTVYAERIYVFLSKSCPRLWIPWWLLTNTAVTSAVTNFRCHKLIAKVNK